MTPQGSSRPFSTIPTPGTPSTCRTYQIFPPDVRSAQENRRQHVVAFILRQHWEYLQPQPDHRRQCVVQPDRVRAIQPPFPFVRYVMLVSDVDAHITIGLTLPWLTEDRLLPSLRR